MITYPEFQVAKVVGPKKSILVEIRRTVLGKGVDWVLVNSVVHYTETGLAKLCSTMELPAEEILTELKKNSAPPAPDSSAAASVDVEKNLPGSPALPAPAARAAVPEVEIVVTGLSPNPLIVFGRLHEVPVKVRVRNNANFIAGLVLRAKESADGLFLMVGTPPRWKGDRIGFTRSAQPKFQENLP